MKARIVMVIMAVALVALPAMAQQETWRSTSTMQGTGSAYAPNLQPIGATKVADMGTTTTTSTNPTGPRRSKDDPGEVEPFIDPGSPIGDAVLPLMLMAMLFAGVVYIRRRKALSR